MKKQTSAFVGTNSPSEHGQHGAEKLKALLDESPDTFFLFEPNTGQALLWNQTFREITGYSDKEIARMPAPDAYYSTEDLERAKAFTQQVLEQGTGTIELDLVCKDGRTVPTEYRVSVNCDDQGNPTSILSIGRDTTERRRIEEDLRESEARYRNIVELAPDGIVTVNLKGSVTSCNSAFLELTGFSRDEIIGLHVSKFPTLRIQDIPKYTRLIFSALGGKPIQPLEFIWVHKDGTHRWGEARVGLLKKNAKITGLQVILRDITDRKEADEALQESEERYRTLFEQANDAIFLENEDDEILDANRRACEMLGYTREELLTMTVADLQAPEVRGQEGNIIRQELERHAGALFESVDLHRDGTRIPVEVSTARLTGKESGNVLSIVRDISERKQAEEERARLTDQIRGQARRVEQILTTVPEGVILLDAEGQVLQTNPRGEKELKALAGIEIGDALTHLGNRPLAEILTSPPTRGLWHEVKSGGRIFEVIARSMANDHQPEDWVLVIRDVTREREIERRTHQQEQLAVVGQLAAGIAHDFNNIMAIILLYTQMGLRRPDLPPKLRENLQIVVQQSKRAADLIQQILDFSRRAVLERRPIDLVPFLKEIVRLLERTVPEDVKIELVCGPGEFTINADPTRLQQAVMNLTLNARDAMPEGGELRLEVRRMRVERQKEPPLPEMEAGEWISIAVTDTGCGIPPDVLPHIFEPFFTTKESQRGAGLGLAQVYGLIKQHKGHIDVTTKVGEGTTFTLYLPALLVQEIEQLPKETAVFIRGQGETILLVEDNATLREAMVNSIKALNYQVLEAANGQEALNILEQRADEISLVLSDMVMPEMGGQALFHAMKQRNLAIPVIMLSGHPMESELENLQDHGLAGWMLKPPDMEHLSQLVARTLRGTSD